MCGKSFRKFDYIDCKIILFEVRKIAFVAPCKIGSANFESSGLKTFALYKVNSFNIMLGN
jgi:hypothetical protein